MTGYEAAIQETARLTDKRKELGEYELAELNRKFHQLTECLHEYPDMLLTYFRSDDRKDGGSYLTVRARIKKLNESEQFIQLENGTKIPLMDIYDMEFIDE